MKGMRTTSERRGFVLIELPLVLLVLAILGLAAVAAVHRLVVPVPWYCWPIGFIALPVSMIAFAFLAEKISDSPKR